MSDNSENKCINLSKGQTPRYENHCSGCMFLGQFNEFDLWIHPTPVMISISARSADPTGIDEVDEKNIMKMMIEEDTDFEPLVQAKILAVECGIVSIKSNTVDIDELLKKK